MARVDFPFRTSVPFSYPPGIPVQERDGTLIAVNAPCQIERSSFSVQCVWPESATAFGNAESALETFFARGSPQLPAVVPAGGWCR